MAPSTHSDPNPPYDSWQTAATNIQDAVNAAAGDEVIVNDGVYWDGRATFQGITVSNWVTISQPITLRSVNGPKATIIEGAKDPSTHRPGPQAVRCVLIGAQATLSGFTLTNGATGDPRGPSGVLDYSGSGVLVLGSSELETKGVITNCVLIGNVANSAVLSDVATLTVNPVPPLVGIGIVMSETNVSGTLNEGGHNICSDNSARFSTASSRSDIDPQLGCRSESGQGPHSGSVSGRANEHPHGVLQLSGVGNAPKARCRFSRPG
jgi:hypothetical protein